MKELIINNNPEKKDLLFPPESVLININILRTFFSPSGWPVFCLFVCLK